MIDVIKESYDIDIYDICETEVEIFPDLFRCTLCWFVWFVAIAEILEVCFKYSLYDRLNCLLYYSFLDRWYAKRMLLSVWTSSWHYWSCGFHWWVPAGVRWETYLPRMHWCPLLSACRCLLFHGLPIPIPKLLLSCPACTACHAGCRIFFRFLFILLVEPVPEQFESFHILVLPNV